MGYVKSEIKSLIRESGSRKLASNKCEDWFTEGLRSRKITEVHSTRRRFQPGKIYVFDYSPITENLPWFDRNPVVLAIENVDDNDLGINLNLLPISVKEELLDTLYDRLKSQIENNSTGNRFDNAKLQGQLRITYNGMKTFLQRYGYDFAIRKYKPNRKQNQAVVSYQSWPKIALCDFISLNGTTVEEIRLLFNRNRNI